MIKRPFPSATRLLVFCTAALFLHSPHAAEKSKAELREQRIHAEEEVYRLFNSLTSNAEFHILCRRIRSGSAARTVRRCEPVFMTQRRLVNTSEGLASIGDGIGDMRYDNAQVSRGASLLDSDAELREQLADKYAALEAEMVRIASESPDYLAALQRLAQLNASSQ